MHKLIIKGGNKLSGTIVASGSKNSTLPILFASILGKTPSVLCGTPHLLDIHTTLRLIMDMGGSFILESDGCIQINSQSLTKLQADYNLVKTMRASILALGPILSRYGKVKISLPGGCAIGTRPVDYHIKFLRELGANIAVENGYICAEVTKLKGANIYFDQVSVTATENIIMAAVLAEGTTVIENAAREPEVVDLINFLIKMGADISGAGTATIIINGVKELQGAHYKVCTDRIEVSTYLVAATITNGSITIKNSKINSIQAVVNKLIEAGANITHTEDSISLDMHNRKLKAVDIKTGEFPGFPTDMQAQFMVLNTVANGDSLIIENIFENRFMHVPELQRMGANLELQGNTVLCKQTERLSGACVMATDLRASASLVLAGLVAKGETIIDRVYHLDRGYETIEEKLKILGADINRIKN